MGRWEGKALRVSRDMFVQEVDKTCTSGACSNFTFCYNGVDLARGKMAFMLPRGLGTISIAGTPNSGE